MYYMLSADGEQERQCGFWLHISYFWGGMLQNTHGSSRSGVVSGYISLIFGEECWKLHMGRQMKIQNVYLFGSKIEN